MPRGVYPRKKDGSDEGTDVEQADDIEQADGALCQEGCFPAGWPEDAYTAGCEHGTWNRDAGDVDEGDGGQE